MKSPLYRLLYTSVRASICEAKCLDRILQKAQHNNRKYQITGILTYTQHRFFQYLEGGQQELEQLYQAIQQDERHQAVTLQDFAPIPKRLFPYWQMAHRDLSTQEIILSSRLHPHEEEIFQQILSTSLQSNEKGLSILRHFLVYD